jgi:hypothetical protein
MYVRNLLHLGNVYLHIEKALFQLSQHSYPASRSTSGSAFAAAMTAWTNVFLGICLIERSQLPAMAMFRVRTKPELVCAEAAPECSHGCTASEHSK